MTSETTASDKLTTSEKIRTGKVKNGKKKSDTTQVVSAENAQTPKVGTVSKMETTTPVKTITLNSVTEITDEDFNNPTRNIILPSLPQKLLNLIGKKSKPVLLKKNILEKNKKRFVYFQKK